MNVQGTLLVINQAKKYFDNLLDNGIALDILREDKIYFMIYKVDKGTHHFYIYCSTGYEDFTLYLPISQASEKTEEILNGDFYGFIFTLDIIKNAGLESTYNLKIAVVRNLHYKRGDIMCSHIYHLSSIHNQLWEINTARGIEILTNYTISKLAQKSIQFAITSVIIAPTGVSNEKEYIITYDTGISVGYFIVKAYNFISFNEMMNFVPNQLYNLSMQVTRSSFILQSKLIFELVKGAIVESVKVN